MKINLKLLKEQKLTIQELINVYNRQGRSDIVDNLEGVLHLMDAVGDEASIGAGNPNSSDCIHR